MRPKWSEPFVDVVQSSTNIREFTHELGVTVIHGDRSKWEHNPDFITALGGNPVRLIELREMLEHIRNVSSTTVASSAIGRVIQLMSAAEKGKKELSQVVKAQTTEEEKPR